MIDDQEVKGPQTDNPVADAFMRELILAEKVNRHLTERLEYANGRIEVLKRECSALIEDRDKWRDRVLAFRVHRDIERYVMQVNFMVDRHAIADTNPGVFESWWKEMTARALREFIEKATGAR